MVPISINNNQNFDEEGFKTYILEICKHHKSENRALAFAFIVYDFSNHTISEILNKHNFWDSLDTISGKFLSVFYLDTQENHHQRRQEEIYQSDLRYSKSRQDTMSFFVPITRKAMPIDNAVSYLKKEFQLEEKVRTPFVLFFQLDNEESVSDSFIIELKKEKLEDAFLELRDHIRNGVEALSDILPENYVNHQEIFNLLKSGVDSGKFYSFIRQTIKPKLGIGTIISIVKLISGSI